MDIRYAVLHPALFVDLSALSSVEEYLERQLDAQQIYRDDELTVYQIGAGASVAPLDADITLTDPPLGSRVDSLTPRLRWTRGDAAITVEQIQVSLDRNFGQRGFLYFETRDAALAHVPRTYAVPPQYPLQPGHRYYWRVRGVVGGQPGLWSAVGSFWSPSAASPNAPDVQVHATGERSK
ncbi:MAG: hypothetical protein NTZ05_08205 [Chloroflexi bacterium]|nr:hypothetical protein [Chloroflexota bacterium]